MLYEMLTGRRCFEGETVSDTLAAVLMREPDWSALPAATPAAVRRVLKRCLDRNPKTRLHDIADARLEMDETAEPIVTPAPPVAAPATRRSRAAWVVVAVLASAGAAGWWRALSAGGPAPGIRTAFAVSMASGDVLAYDDTPLLALSRDGRRLVYAAERNGARQLFLRDFDEVEARPLEGTSGARSPFFSPDGQWIGFFAEGKLLKVPAGGGPAQTICDGVTAHRGAAWAEDETIILTPDYAAGLSRVSARGGRLEPLTKPDAGKGERTHRWPEVLPGGEAVLFTIGLDKSPGNYDDANIALLARRTGQTRVLFEGGSMPRYCPSGHLLYVRSKSLLAVRFDLARKKVVGEPFPLPEKIAGDPSSGIGYFAVGLEGSLVFVPGGTVSADGKLLLTDHKGAVTELPLPQRPYRFPHFSPDGRRIAFSVGNQIRVTKVQTQPTFKAGLPQLLFEGQFELRTAPLRNYDVTRDGKRFVFVRGGSDLGAREIDVVLHWARDLERPQGRTGKP